MKTKIPLCYQSQFTPVAEALVDPWVHEILSPFTWWVSRADKPAPGKMILKLGDHGTIPRTLYLNRAVVLLVVNPEVKELFRHGLWTQIWELSTSLPPVRFMNSNPFDCRVANLIWRTGEQVARLLAGFPETQNPVSEPNPNSFFGPWDGNGTEEQSLEETSEQTLDEVLGILSQEPSDIDSTQEPTP